MVRGAIYCPVHMLCVRAKCKKEAEAGKRTLMLDFEIQRGEALPT